MKPRQQREDPQPEPKKSKARLASTRHQIRNAWLRGVASQSWVRDLLIPCVVGLGWYLASGATDIQPEAAVGEVIGVIIAAGIAYFVVQRSRYWGFRDVLRTLAEISDTAREPGRSFFVDLTTARTQETLRVVRGLAVGPYRAETTELLQEWFDTFFSRGGDNYSALDSHLPSRYLKDYGWYLSLHEAAMDRERINRGGARILAVDRNALTSDYLANSQAYAQFHAWHRSNGVEAKWIDPSRLADLRNRYGVTNVVDIGLWDDYAVLFSREGGSDAVSLTMVFRGDGTAEVPYENIYNYMNAVNRAAALLGPSPPGLEMGDDHLVAEWEDYVDPGTRTADGSVWARFLLSQLEDSRIVLDAAAGIGCDSVFLADKGFSVVSNEVDARLYAAASDFAENRGRRLELKRALWEELPREIGGGFQFDAVLVVGNSLCLVDSPQRRARAVQAFFDVLRPGGKLIIDERNFHFMQRNRAEILADPLNKFPPVSRGDVMYPGSSLRGYPSAISEAVVKWSFFRNDEPRVEDSSEVFERSKEYSSLTLYPFSHGEMFELLQGRGFSDIWVFRDLRPLTDGPAAAMPSSEAVGDAAFLTYVATKPH